ncbi:hypothetical protein [Arthrobacter sp. PsM3]|uniref:hypothetical protein n=1 Tax=Arthrobacter sp. PsM3 TaxID=3030531 RepID=UPI00263B6173|nr:hypothetical protein [Arthrobacter sp. PsM3]MDN4643728.1 hypothetical protein [Arthrobacter sp. PsM3]
MSDTRLPGGAVAELAPARVSPMQSLTAPSHCGMAMEWKAPASATKSVYSYSFAPADAAAELPPVWRCGCGFQLDGAVHTSGILFELSR